MGKFLAVAILISAVVAGAAMYYLQVYHFYEEVAATGTDDVQLTSLVTGAPEPVLYDAFQAIDADSSPIRYRACFTTPMRHPMLTETYELYERAEPLNAPGSGPRSRTGARWPFWARRTFNTASTGSSPSPRTARAMSGTRSTAAARWCSTASPPPRIAPNRRKDTDPHA
jgi:hypothetical protein